MKQDNIVQEKVQNNLNKKIFKYSKMEKSKILESFNTTELGYTAQQANELLQKNGYNKIESEEEVKWYDIVIKSFFDPFSIILMCIILISVFTDVILVEEKSYAKIIILSLIILVSGTIHFIQDFKTKKSMKKLKEMVSNKISIIRGGVTEEISLIDIVVGDIIKLSAGDLIPADLRVISSKDLFISQSSLTGESEPIEKFELNSKDTTDIFELENICYMGTSIVSGTALVIVIAIGKDTYLGQMSKTMVTKKGDTAFDKGIKKITWLLIKITMVMVPIVFFINIATKGNILDSFIYAVAVAVGITPELLLVIVTSNLAKGSIQMAKKKTIVKDLNSIQNLGAMNILCTDKTGTLTQDHIVLEEYLDVYGNEDMRVLRHAFLNSHFQTGLKNLIDIAIIEKAKSNNLVAILDNYIKVDEIPFDFIRRRMSVVIEDKNGKKQLITKGSVEEVLSICKYAEIDGNVKEINNELNNEIMKIANKLNTNGLRVVAIAQKNEFYHDVKTFGVQDEYDMILIGYVAFLDPPKESAKSAIQALNGYGVAVKVITGDNELVAKKVCYQVGIDTTNSLTGKQIEKMSETELLSVVEKTTLFSKISPIQKANIVKALQSKGHIIGYMGDGINDAPALVQADVGISVDGGVEIAKESADIILLEKSLMVLTDGLIEGRKVFANIMKYLKMGTSSNVGNMISVLFASIFIPFLPMLPIHILLQNLLYDISQIGIPFDNVDKEYLKIPRKWEIKEISKFIVWFAPISTFFDLVTFAVLWYIIGANTIANQALFQSGWFLLGLLSQTVIVHIIRTKKIPFIQSRPSSIMVFSTLVITIIGLIIPYTVFGSYVGLVPLPSVYLWCLLVIMIAYILITEVVKRIYIKFNKDWV
ncbi:MAG: magnesium-translocating P-type ATPase [Clostridia bacterium]|nr:magnesium-translocating P-type ATPase [Clostridia bacterium]MDD4387480.1 magnesium-translocating P-type ATPase [Clostridia bacterium]